MTEQKKPWQIADLLGTGKGNATPTKHLMMLTGWDERTVRKQIEHERRRGIPILSCKDGYFLSADEAERAAFVASMRGRAREILRTADAVESEGRG